MIDFAVLSDKGRQRGRNQDAVKVNSDCRLFLLADGMGGHAAGEVASKIAVDAVDEFVERALGTNEVTWPFGYDIRKALQRNVLETAIRLANLKVCQEAEQRDVYAGMGSTLVCLLLDEEEKKSFFSHVGDSRLYLLRQGELRQMTEDHSMVQEQLRMGIITPEEAESHAFRHIVTRAIGSQTLEFEVQDLELEAGDFYLLCCDGLTDELDDPDIQRIIESQEEVEAVCQSLVDAANEAGGADNISVVAVHYREGS